MVDLFMPSLIQRKADSFESKPTDASTKNNEGNCEMFKCGQCFETFRTLVAKKKHEKFYHFFSKPFICECGQQFGKLCEVNYHVRRVHNKEKNYVCHICKKAFFKNSDLVIHQNVHEQSAKFICEDCGRRFKHVSNLIRHTRIHTGIKPYLCLPCNKRFSQVAALRQHETTEKHKEMVAEENKKKNESCKGINKQEKNSSDGLLGKTNKCESSNSNSLPGSKKRRWWFYCKICGERFPFSVLLRDHETKHVVNKDIKCNSCKAEFSCIKDFHNHSCMKALQIQLPKKISAKSEVPVERTNERAPDGNCMGNESEEVFNDKDKKVELTLTQSGQIMLDNDEVLLTLNDKVYGLLLINNDVTVLENDDYLQMLNTPRSEDIHGLTEIESVFNIGNIQGDLTADDGVSRLVLPDNWQWTEKSLSPEGNNPGVNISENVSNATLRNDSQDKKLAKKGYNLSKVQEHKCQECKKTFSWSSSLRNHIQKKHTKKKEYSCSSCSKIYCSTLLVQHHIKRDHLNIRSYKCTFCEKAFFRRYDLKVHIRIHTDERPYICGVCGKRFRHLSHSIRHDRTHLKDATRGRKKAN